MATAGSISQNIRRLKDGESAAAQKLWDGYFHRLVTLARKKLRATARRAADEEDVALSAFDSFCRGAQAGRFPQLCDRHNLWSLLVKITERKGINLARRNARLKRGAGKVQGESALATIDPKSDRRPGIDQVSGPEPTPAFAAQMVEEYARLMDILDDAELRSIALMKFEGYANTEIAASVGCAVATVERRLRLIRTIWEKELAS